MHVYLTHFLLSHDLCKILKSEQKVNTVIYIFRVNNLKLFIIMNKIFNKTEGEQSDWNIVWCTSNKAHNLTFRFVLNPCSRMMNLYFYHSAHEDVFWRVGLKQEIEYKRTSLNPSSGAKHYFISHEERICWKIAEVSQPWRGRHLEVGSRLIRLSGLKVKCQERNSLFPPRSGIETEFGGWVWNLPSFHFPWLTH